MSNSISRNMEHKRLRLFTHCFLPMMLMVSVAFFIGTAFVITDYKERKGWGSVIPLQLRRSLLCQTQHKPNGCEALPEGIISKTSDLEMRSLWSPKSKQKRKSSMNLLAIAVGVKQKESVNEIIKKFPASEFVLMLFHYDGIVDEWKDLEWNERAIHVSAVNQTKWWFAKRFLHPDIVSEYAYIFLWDEDLGVKNFNANRYLSIIKEEGLEISQPAIDPGMKSELHHPITARNNKTRVHRRTYEVIGRTKCAENSIGPPCTGFVEMMAPVFSIASWRCAWHMIQTDLIYGWGVDFQLGYCAQGDRSKNIGIVDAEYLVHNALPTLGGLEGDDEEPSKKQESRKHESTGRSEIRSLSYAELETFKRRWRQATQKDDCWIDPYDQSSS